MQATELRKKLFQVLEEVARGEIVEISYKGTALKIVSAERSTRLGRLVERDLGVAVEARDSAWNGAVIPEWEAETKKLLGHAMKRAAKPK